VTHKGSWQRPTQVTKDERDLRHDITFCKDEKEKRALIRKLKKLEKSRL